MYIIVGLGNPGKKYENTRHNIGFIALDYLAQKHDISITRIKHKALVGEGRIAGQKVLLVKPQTYMNLSGNCVREVLEYYKEDTEKLLVIYDDIDIPAGSVRIRKKGSAGTHNGMRSIIYDIQTDQFPRIRIGMGKSDKIPLADFVTGSFSKDEKDIFEKAVMHASEAVESFIENGIEKTVSEYSTKGAVGENKGNE